MRKNYLCKNLGIKKGGGSLLKGAVFSGTHGIILSLSLSLSTCIDISCTQPSGRSPNHSRGRDVTRRQHTHELERETERVSEKDGQNKGWHLTDHKVEVHGG